MSGSAPGMENKCEPNLTPLLDMVLQLVMFFMLCANFIMESVNESIKLPTALEAKAIDKNTTGFVMLNLREIDGVGKVLLGSGDKAEVLSLPMVKKYMADQMAFDKQKASPVVWEKGGGRSVVILRADKSCGFKYVHEVMVACRQAGYHDVQLRAIHGVPMTGPGG